MGYTTFFEDYAQVLKACPGSRLMVLENRGWDSHHADFLDEGARKLGAALKLSVQKVNLSEKGVGLLPASSGPCLLRWYDDERSKHVLYYCGDRVSDAARRSILRLR